MLSQVFSAEYLLRLTVCNVYEEPQRVVAPGQPKHGSAGVVKWVKVAWCSRTPLGFRLVVWKAASEKVPREPMRSGSVLGDTASNKKSYSLVVGFLLNPMKLD